MSKNVKHITRKVSNGNTCLMSFYKNIRKKQAKKLINRLYKKLGYPLLARTSCSILIPDHFIEIIRTSARGVVVVRVLGKHIREYTTEDLLKAGATHFYNNDIDEWISFEEAQTDIKNYNETIKRNQEDEKGQKAIH